MKGCLGCLVSVFLTILCLIGAAVLFGVIWIIFF